LNSPVFQILQQLRLLLLIIYWLNKVGLNSTRTGAGDRIQKELLWSLFAQLIVALEVSYYNKKPHSP